MSDQQDTASTSPATDAMAGAFFLVWAAIGWTSYASNQPLRASLGAGADPGPALLPLIALGALTLGGLTILAKGLLRLRQAQSPAHDVPGMGSHVRPLLFAVTVILLAMLLRPVGFIVASSVFTIFWLYVLPAGMTISLRKAAIAITVGLALSLGIHVIFAHFLLVPLPG